MNARTAPRNDDGFTLVELLIVIVILGVLASVTVYTVSGLSNRGSTVAQEGDAMIVTRAQEVYYAQYGEYATEDELVETGLLARPSPMHDVDVTVDRSSYTLVADGVTTTTTVSSWPTGEVESVTFQDLSVQQYGDGAQIAVLIPATDTDVPGDWAAFTGSQPAIPGLTLYYVDDPGLDTVAELELLLDASDFQLLPIGATVDGEDLISFTKSFLGSPWTAPDSDVSGLWTWRDTTDYTIDDFATFVADRFGNGDPVGEQTTYAGFDAWSFFGAPIDDLKMVSVGTPATRSVYEDWLLETVESGMINALAPPVYIEDADITTTADLHDIVLVSPVRVAIPAAMYADYVDDYPAFAAEVVQFGTVGFGTVYFD